MSNNRVQVDTPTVERKDAASLVVHHLALAFGYYQAIPEGGELKALKEEIDKQFQGFNLEATIAENTCVDLFNKYEELKDED